MRDLAVEQLKDHIAELRTAEAWGVPTACNDFIDLVQSIPDVCTRDDDVAVVNRMLRDLAQEMTDRICDSDAPQPGELVWLDWVHSGGCDFDEPLEAGIEEIVDIIDRDLFPRMGLTEQCDYLGHLFWEFRYNVADPEREARLEGSGQYYDRFLQLFADFKGRGDDTVAGHLLELDPFTLRELGQGGYVGLSPHQEDNYERIYSSRGACIRVFADLLLASYHGDSEWRPLCSRICQNLSWIGIEPVAPQPPRRRPSGHGGNQHPSLKS